MRGKLRNTKKFIPVIKIFWVSVSVGVVTLSEVEGGKAQPRPLLRLRSV